MAFSLHRLGALDLDRAAALHDEAFVALGERGWTRADFAGLLASPGVGGVTLLMGAGVGWVMAGVYQQAM